MLESSVFIARITFLGTNDAAEQPLSVQSSLFGVCVVLFVWIAHFPGMPRTNPSRLVGVITTAEHRRHLPLPVLCLLVLLPGLCVSDVSPRAECLGIQGTGKNADICCASDCTCACGGDVPENAGKDCFLTEIRAEPPGICTGAELNAACALVAGTS